MSAAPAKHGPRTSDTPIRLLHLSDFHLRESRRWDSDPVLNGLAGTIEQIVGKGLRPDVVAVTGDIAFAGREEDYQQARQWIDNGLLPALRPRFPRRNILVVPGNHDVDHRTVDFTAETVQSRLLDDAEQDAIATVLGDEEQRRIVLKRHNAYVEFANGLRAPHNKRDLPWWSTTLKVRGSRIHFAGLCSSWMSCCDQDYGKLLLGRWQVNTLFADAAKADWSVALLHHPWAWLAPFDAEELEAKVHHECDVVLRGLLHRQQARAIHYPDEVCLELAAGSAYAGSQYPNAFQLLELHSNPGKVTVHFWIWQGTKWIPDRNACPDGPDGVAAFLLGAPQAGPTPTALPRPVEPDKYLGALRDRTSHIDIRGLLVGSGRAPRLTIDELYIPLTTTLHEPIPAEQGKAKGRMMEEARGAARVELHEALKHRRLVIVGDPGSGKTTFLKRIAYLLCRTLLGERPDAAKEQLGLDDRPFPILIRLADLAEHVRGSRERKEGPIGRDAPDWLADFLATSSREDRTGLTEACFQAQLEGGSALVLLDGLDEAPSREDRQLLAALVERAARAYSDCRFVLTSRPAAFRGEVLLPEFTQVQIDALEDEAIGAFLTRWCEALFSGTSTQMQRHLEELLTALQKPEIRRLARNPVMLTAMAVVHWNEKRLPEQRADLYESIIGWLARAREKRPGRPAPERCVGLHQELALPMQDHPDGRQVQIPRFEAAKAIAPEWREVPEDQRFQAALGFLVDEEVDSGIIVGRGDHVRFWHLIFQEFLAARALAGRDDQRQELFGRPELYQPEWREVVLLLAGVLCHQSTRRVDAMFSAVLDALGDDASLAEQARCFGLLGAAVQDLSPVNYQPRDPRYKQIADAVLGIFDPQRSESVAVKVAIEAADALGQAGDPRFAPHKLDSNWVEIPAEEFWMGAQAKDPSKRHYDPEAFDGESPVHKVYLDAYRIGKYPVTVGEYRRFVDAAGYQQEGYWQSGGFGQQEQPENWDDQLQHPNRPVVGVTWYEAAAYATWAGCRLPTEAEWERAARGTEARKYPWGNDLEPDPSLLNYYESKIGDPTPVGVYPRGATPDGIQDMAGNVWEWCHDRWCDRYPDSEAWNPTGPEQGDRRVVRGGCWLRVAGDCRSSYRLRYHPSLRLGSLGFRLVCSILAARTH